MKWEVITILGNPHICLLYVPGTYGSPLLLGRNFNPPKQGQNFQSKQGSSKGSVYVYIYKYLYIYIYVYIYICVVCENHNQTVLSILTATFDNSPKILKKWTTESSLRESRDTSIFSAYLETFLVFMAKIWGRFCISWWKLSCQQVLVWPQKTKPYTFCSDHIEAILGWHVHDTHVTTSANLAKPNIISSHHPSTDQTSLIHSNNFRSLQNSTVPQCQPPFFQRRYFRNRNQNRSPGGAWSPASVSGQSFYTGQVSSSYISVGL